MVDIVAGLNTEEVKVVTEVKEVKPPVETKKEPEYTELEQKAMDQGWNPDWDGPEDQKRSAREYIDRGVLLSTAKSQSNEIKQLRDDIAKLAAHNQKVFESGYANALKDLNAQKAKAIDESDGQKVIALDEAIDQTKQAIYNSRVAAVTPKPVTPGESETFAEFKKTNAWYSRDEDMRDWAHGVALSFAKQSEKEGLTINEVDVYKHIEEKARKKYPEKYGRSGPPSPNGEGRQSSGGRKVEGSNRAFDDLIASLPEDQQNAAKHIVKLGLVTKEKYVEDYERMGR